jgi:organic radical activating enzyme
LAVQFLFGSGTKGACYRAEVNSGAYGPAETGRSAADGVADRISIELSRLCSKGCGFCYNGSNREGATSWTVDDLIAFTGDCAANGVRAFSFGGGEPLEAPELLFPVLDALRGRAARTLTTNGLFLDAAAIGALERAEVNKVHVSLHMPGDRDELTRVIRQVHELAAARIRSGINLLVRASRIAEARDATAAIHAAGISNQRIVFLPMRGRDVPSAAEVAHVAGGPFQSMSCLTGCAKSPRFVSIGADRSIAWCSYTVARRTLSSPTYESLATALDGLNLIDCEETHGGLVRLSRRSQHGHEVVRDRP